MEDCDEALRDKVAAAIPRGCRLSQIPRQDGTVWAATCAEHAPGAHRYTVEGVACWDWGETLEEAAEAIEAKPPRGPGRPPLSDSSPTTVIQVKLPEPMRDVAQALAKAEGVSLMEWVRRAMRDAMGEQIAARARKGQG
jgi:hypothetical protein